MKTKVLVIGSNSFSGSDFIDLLLARGRYDVVGISRSPKKQGDLSLFRFFEADVNTQFDKITKILARFRPDYVINFAGLIEVSSSWKYPHQYLQTNTVALSRLIDYLSRASYLVRYVHISSAEVYGSCNNIREDAPVRPSSPYAVSKAASDLLVLAYIKTMRFPAVIIRSTNVYGPGQQLFRIIPKSIISIKKHSPIPLHGGGRAIKSYIHIRDVSTGELAIMERGRIGEIYHLSPDRGITIKKLITTICKLMNVPYAHAVRVVPDRPGGQDRQYLIDSSKARKEFDWRPEISLRDGIGDVIGWINEHWSTISKLPTSYTHRA